MREREAFNLANALTLGRIALVPLLVVLLLGEASPVAALAVFGAGAASDALDGHIARSRGLVTDFGRLMDPFADKLLVGSALICLVSAGRLATWVAAVVIARELAVTILRAVARRRGTVISASSLGKAKTACQVLLIGCLIVASDPGAAWLDGLVGVTVTITVMSGIDYFLAYGRGARRHEPRLAISGAT